MYQAHFHFTQEPFSIAPDPSFLYLSKAHKEALAHLMYGFSHGGFVLITGEVGTGKTTLLRNLLKQTPSDLDVAFILNPRLTVRELLETLCQELGVPYDPQTTQTVKQYIDALNRHLLRTHQLGRSTVVIIDEAQNLSPAVLEQVRLLTNLETDEKKLMRIILVGQPELTELLARQELRQLAQRITARYHLGSLSREDCYAYVAHRLSRAGGHPQIFSNGALRRLFRLSKGTPRVINVIADRALLGAYVENRHKVTARTVSRAAREVLGEQSEYRLWLAASLIAVGAAGIGWVFLQPGERVTSAQTGRLPSEPEQPAVNVPAESVIDPATSAPQATAATLEPPMAATVDQATANDAAGLTNAIENPVTASATAAVNLQAADPERIATNTATPTPPAAVVTSATATPATENPLADSAAALPPFGSAVRPAGSTYDLQRQAYAAVFARWGADYLAVAEEIIPCDFAPSAGLQCLSQYGSWSNIEQTDLPVLLELWDEQPAPYHAALTYMRNAELTLGLGGKELRVTRRELRDAWFGAYVVLWQTPPGYRGSIRRGDTHETVGWLRQQLDGVTDQSLNSSNPDYFDETLHDAVVAFQRNEGLIIDGVVGPATWIRLSTRLRLPAPRLSS